MPIQELPPQSCHDLREADPSVVLLDVRTPEEFALGHPRGALNVPIFFRDPAAGMTPNPEFLEVCRRVTRADRRVILSCAVGGRSRRGCEALEAEGYSSLVNMAGGFNGLTAPDGSAVERGWRDVGLPVSTEAGERSWDALRSEA